MMSADAVIIQDVSSWRDLIEVELASNPPAQAAVQLRLDPEARTARLEAWHKIHGQPMDEYHGLVLTWRVRVAGAVDGPALVDELRGDELQGALGAICDHWTARWDGSNWVGVLDEVGEGTSDWLDEWLSSAPTLGDSAGLRDAYEWIQTAPDGMTAETTDDELSDLAEELVDLAEDSYVVLDADDVYEVLDRQRQALRDDVRLDIADDEDE